GGLLRSIWLQSAKFFARCCRPSRNCPRSAKLRRLRLAARWPKNLRETFFWQRAVVRTLKCFYSFRKKASQFRLLRRRSRVLPQYCCNDCSDAALLKFARL